MDRWSVIQRSRLKENFKFFFSIGNPTTLRGLRRPLPGEEKAARQQAPPPAACPLLAPTRECNARASQIGRSIGMSKMDWAWARCQASGGAGVHPLGPRMVFGLGAGQMVLRWSCFQWRRGPERQAPHESVAWEAEVGVMQSWRQDDVSHVSDSSSLRPQLHLLCNLSILHLLCNHNVLSLHTSAHLCKFARIKKPKFAEIAKPNSNRKTQTRIANPRFKLQNQVCSKLCKTQIW